MLLDINFLFVKMNNKPFDSVKPILKDCENSLIKKKKI